MTTLAIMKDRIAREIRRPGITTQIGEAINTAIEFYRGQRLFMLDRDSVDVPLVIDQASYTVSDDANIGLLERLDYLHLVWGSQTFNLARRSPEWMDTASLNGQSSGQPFTYSWFAQAIRLYPIPNIADMSMRMSGQFHVAAPTDDNATGNAWMVEGEQLIRCHAKYELYTHVLLNMQMSEMFDPEGNGTPTARALAVLKRRSTHKQTDGIVAAMTL